MPVTVIAEWTRGDRDTTIHDEVFRRLGIADDPPAGLIVHTSGTTATGVFRIQDVWESEQAWEAFRRERLRPVVDAVLAGLPPGEAGPAESPSVSVYELHHLTLPGAVAAPR